MTPKAETQGAADAHAAHTAQTSAAPVRVGISRPLSRVAGVSLHAKSYDHNAKRDTERPAG